MKKLSTHISNVPFAAPSVHRDLAGYVHYDDDGAEEIAAVVVARRGKGSQQILAGEEFAQHDKNTRYFGVRRALQRLGEI